MKLAVLAALFGATLASSNLVTLPEWEVNPTCKYRLQKEATDINTAIRKMPMTSHSGDTDAQKKRAVLHRKAAIAVAKYFATIDNACHDTDKGFYCPNSSQKQIKASFIEMRNALDACNSKEADTLKREIYEFFKMLDDCSTMVDKDDIILIKVTLPPNGRDRIKEEWRDVKVELKKLHNNPQWVNIRNNLK